MARFVVKKSKDAQYFWIFVADNGETIVQTETYKQKESAQQSIDLVQKSAALARVDDES